LETGLIREVFALAGLVFGILLAGQLFRPFARSLFGPEPGSLENAGIFLVILVAIWMGAGLLGRMARQAARWILLGWLDRLGGLAFGALKGLILIEVFLILFARFPVSNIEALIQGSVIAGWISRYAPAVMALLPPEFQQLNTILHQQ
jgi:uncharacterized membrane protein required for colicin V production